MEAEAGSQVLAKLGSDLDGRFKTVRNEEANLGNLLADVAMAALQVSHPMIVFVKLRQGSGKDGQGMAVKAKGLKA